MFVKGLFWRVFELPEDLSGDVALERTLDFSGCFMFCFSALHVGDGGWVMALTAQHDGVDRVVELAVTATIEAVTVRETRRCRDRCGAGKVRERGFVTASAWV